MTEEQITQLALPLAQQMLQQYKIPPYEPMVLIGACLHLIRACILCLSDEERQRVRDQLVHTVH